MSRSCSVQYKKYCSLFTFFIVLLLQPSLAAAHKIKIFAAPEGEAINGICYYPGGDKYRQGTVMVFGPDNVLLGKVTTDDKGAFTFKPSRKTDHIFVIETADGHRAQYTVKAAELSLAAGQEQTATGPAGTNAQHPEAARPSTSATAVTAAGTKKAAAAVSSGELQELLDTTIARHINPLREQLDRYEEKIRLHDVLGGIGYILGLAGLAFYCLGRKKRN